MPDKVFGGPFLLVLALVLAAPMSAFAKWQGITGMESRIVFSGRHFEDYRAVHHYLPFKESDYRHESYRAQWRAGSRRLPVFWVRLQVLAPGRHFPSSLQRSLDQFARRFGWFKDEPFLAGETGTAGTVVGPANYLIFTAGKHRCAVFRLFVHDGTVNDPDTFGNTVMTGLYCPVSGQIGAGALEALVARLGIQGIAVPEAEERQAGPAAASRQPSMGSLAKLVASGNIRALRRVAAKDFDPDTIIAFQHPRFARGRMIERPILMAAALFGQTEMVVFLLNKGASTTGRSSGAICAAIAMRHRDIVEVLLRKEPALAQYDRCGADGTQSAVAVARRLGHDRIADRLLETGR